MTHPYRVVARADRDIVLGYFETFDAALRYIADHRRIKLAIEVFGRSGWMPPVVVEWIPSVVEPAQGA